MNPGSGMQVHPQQVQDLLRERQPECGSQPPDPPSPALRAGEPSVQPFARLRALQDFDVDQHLLELGGRLRSANFKVCNPTADPKACGLEGFRLRPQQPDSSARAWEEWLSDTMCSYTYRTHVVYRHKFDVYTVTYAQRYIEIH